MFIFFDIMYPSSSNSILFINGWVAGSCPIAIKTPLIFKLEVLFEFKSSKTILLTPL